jgi:uncharacterized protein (DUF3820 family)
VSSFGSYRGRVTVVIGGGSSFLAFFGHFTYDPFGSYRGRVIDFSVVIGGGSSIFR